MPSLDTLSCSASISLPSLPSASQCQPIWKLSQKSCLLFLRFVTYLTENNHEGLKLGTRIQLHWYPGLFFKNMTPVSYLKRTHVTLLFSTIGSLSITCRGATQSGKPGWYIM